MTDHRHPPELARAAHLSVLGLISALLNADATSATSFIDDPVNTECLAREALLAAAAVVLRLLHLIADQHDIGEGDLWRAHIDWTLDRMEIA